METAGNSLSPEQASCSAPSLQFLLQQVSALLFDATGILDIPPTVHIDRDGRRLVVSWKPGTRPKPYLNPPSQERPRVCAAKRSGRRNRRGPAAQERSKKRAAEHRARMLVQTVDQDACDHDSRSMFNATAACESQAIDSHHEVRSHWQGST